MLSTQNQRILAVGNDDYLPVLAESFLTDRKAQGLASGTLTYYRFKIATFLNYCEAQALVNLTDITPDFIRRYLLFLVEEHNPGGVHAMYRTLRAFLRWIEAEELFPDWHNPIHKVKAPKIPIEPIEPITLEDVSRLLRASKPRDKAVFLVLLDTGMRAMEFCNLDLSDVDMNTGAVLVRQGKGRKPRTVFMGRKTRRALRAFLRTRTDNCPALFVSSFGERLTYTGLREILRRRSRAAGIKEPTLHDFRRAFALNFLRNGGDIFNLQRLMGHSDLSILRRYLAQDSQDAMTAHSRFSPVERLV